METMLKKVSTLGVDEVEFDPTFTRLIKAKGYCSILKKVAQEYGIEIVGLFNDFLYFKPYSSTAKERNKTVESIKRNIDFCKEIGASFFTIAEGNLPQDVKEDEGWERLIEVFGRVADYAEEQGIMVVNEYHPGMFASTLEKAPQLIDDINSKSFKACYDTCHAYVITEGTPEKLIEALGQRIAHVYLGDSDGTPMAHFPIGYGRVNIEQCIRDIQGLGYRGRWSLVLYLTPTPEWAVKTSLEQLEQMFEK